MFLRNVWLTFNGLQGVITLETELLNCISIRALTAMNINTTRFWDVTPCSVVETATYILLVPYAWTVKTQALVSLKLPRTWTGL
jgi:hypothetical protein